MRKNKKRINNKWVETMTRIKEGSEEILKKKMRMRESEKRGRNEGGK